MAIKPKSEIVKQVQRTTARSRNLQIIKEMEDQAKTQAEAETPARTGAQVDKGSGFKGKS